MKFVASTLLATLAVAMTEKSHCEYSSGDLLMDFMVKSRGSTNMVMGLVEGLGAYEDITIEWVDNCTNLTVDDDIEVTTNAGGTANPRDIKQTVSFSAADTLSGTAAVGGVNIVDGSGSDVMCCEFSAVNTNDDIKRLLDQN